MALGQASDCSVYLWTRPAGLAPVEQDLLLSSCSWSLNCMMVLHHVLSRRSGDFQMWPRNGVWSDGYVSQELEEEDCSGGPEGWISGPAEGIAREWSLSCLVVQIWGGNWVVGS
jgi:hypothetical protein